MVCKSCPSLLVLFSFPWVSSKPPHIFKVHPLIHLSYSLLNLSYLQRATDLCNQIVQFSSVTQLCLTLWDPMDCRTPGFPVHHQLPELTQTHVHWVSDAIQPSHPLSSPSPPIFDLSQHQDLFKWVSSSHQVAKESEFQLQHQSFQWISLQPNKLCLKNLIKVDFISWVFNPILLATPADGREVWMIQSILAEGAFSQPDLRRSKIEEIQCEIRAACWCFRGSHTASADIFNPIDHTQWPSFLWQQSI